MNWVTYYAVRPRRNPWLKHFLIGGGALVVAIASWLWWQPKTPDRTEELLGFSRRTRPTNGPSVRSTSSPRSSPIGRELSPPLPTPRVGSNLVSSSGDRPAQFKPNPNLIVPAASSHRWPARPVQTVGEAQIALARRGLSPGSVDGLPGPRTAAAIRAFQLQQRLPPTGLLDSTVKSRLLLAEPPYTHQVVSSEDLSRLGAVPESWIEKSRLPRLDYETLIELVAERWQCDPDFIRQLNQNLDWSRLTVGSSLVVPNVRSSVPIQRAGWARIGLAQRSLTVFDTATNLLAWFPCSIARQTQDRLVGKLQVTSIAPNPHYTFDPDRFPGSPEARLVQGTLTIPPGPNNPVGSVWIGLDQPGYGIHGTPQPERVGEAASLGCFRLANWNVELLARLTWVGMPVLVEPR